MFFNVFLMIFRVAEAQNVDFFGPEGDFFHVRKRGRFLHRFFTEKVTKMTPQGLPKVSKTGEGQRVFQIFLVFRRPITPKGQK